MKCFTCGCEIYASTARRKFCSAVCRRQDSRRNREADGAEIDLRDEWPARPPEMRGPAVPIFAPWFG